MAGGYGSTPGSGFAVEEIDGEKYLVVKINIGEDGETANITADNPIPVKGENTRSTVGALNTIVDQNERILMLLESIAQ